MDLRIERTKRCIKDAFIELRKIKPIEKITVKELAMLASINKATFYSHYNDIYDLSEQLENETIFSILENIPHIDSLITNPAIAIEELTDTLIKQKAFTDILFSGSRSGLYAKKLETGIKTQVFNQYPDHKNDFHWNMILTYLIQGGLYSSTTYLPVNPKETQRLLCELNVLITEHFITKQNK